MAKRLLTVLAMLPIGIFLIYSQFSRGFLTFIGIIIVCILISFEIFSLLEKRGFRFYLWTNCIALTLSNLSFFLYGFGTFDIAYLFVIQFSILCVYLLIVVVTESISGNFESSMENIGISVFSYILLGVFAPMIGMVKMLDLSGWLLTILCGVTWLTDTGGLVFGKYFGKHKLKQLSSPNKTVEGYIGAYLFGFLTAGLFYVMQNIFPLASKFSLIQMVLITFAIINASIIGDLGESTLKRWANTKDSGDFLPGHGGFFDRFDSVIFSGPVFYLSLKFLGY